MGHTMMLAHLLYRPSIGFSQLREAPISIDDAIHRSIRVKMRKAY